MIDLIPNVTLLPIWGMFLIVVVALSQLVFKPTLKLLDERRNKTSRLNEQTTALLEKTKTSLQEFEQRMAKARAEAASEREKILSAAHAEERAIMEKARQENETVLEKMKADIARERESAAAQLKSQAEGIARDMASKILERNVA